MIARVSWSVYYQGHPRISIVRTRRTCREDADKNVKPLPSTQITWAVFDIDKSVAHQGGESAGQCIGSLPDGGNHGLLVLLIPLDRDSEKARWKRGFEESQKEANCPYSVDDFCETQSEDTLCN